MNVLFALLLALFAGDDQAEIRYAPVFEYRLPIGRLNPAIECGDPAKHCPCGEGCRCVEETGRACECPNKV